MVCSAFKVSISYLKKKLQIPFLKVKKVTLKKINEHVIIFKGIQRLDNLLSLVTCCAHMCLVVKITYLINW